MDERQKKMFLGIAGQRVRFDLPMSEYTTFRVGGRADAIFFAEDGEELRRVVSCATAEEIPCLVVGKGSNLLVKDGGIRGLVIMLRGSLATVRRDGEDEQVLVAGGGAAFPDLLRSCVSEGLTGLEFLAGIPGTAGGAVLMNAGARGKETGSLVEGIQIVNPLGETVTLGRSELEFSYRRSSVPAGHVIASVRFRLQREEGPAISRLIEENLKRRKASQPLDYPSAGSVFKNPPHDFAGRLMERSGLKGKRAGGAMISTRHANFIVNTGEATAADVLALMELARERVREETGIDLEPEIRVVGV